MKKHIKIKTKNEKFLEVIYGDHTTYITINGGNEANLTPEQLNELITFLNDNINGFKNT